MNMLFPWNLNILYIIYYLSPNAFSYIVSAHFLHKECDGPCLVTWWTFLSSKDCIILVLKELSYYIVFKRICINYLHKCTEYFFCFLHWQDIILDFLKILLFILVCGLPIWTCSLLIGEGLSPPPISKKMVFFGRSSLPLRKLKNIPANVWFC